MFFFHREKDEDEGIPSETEEDKKLLETKTKEMRGEQNPPIHFHMKNKFGKNHATN